MANRYLMPVYKKLYGQDFNFYDFDQRMQMQKAVYLLQDMGVPVGDYGFRWYLHGPYSQTLQDDMHYEKGNCSSSVTIFEEYDQQISQLHKVIHSEERGSYTMGEWVECLASMRYLQTRMMRRSATEEDVLAELKKRKDHLADDAANHNAFRLLEGLFAV